MTMSMEERMYWLSFSVFPGIGAATFKKLLQRFGNAKEAWSAPQKDLKELLREKILEKFIDFRSSFPLEAYLKEMKRKDVWFITLFDDRYPKLLKKIKRPPIVLFGKGNSANLAGQTDKDLRGLNGGIAIVGTRKMTEYGREITEMFARELVLHGFIIVSGLALGVDACAHSTALESNGITIAVLGCGVDCCLPVENQEIYRNIIKKNGAVISEFPLNHPPTIGSFPSRNRIIAGLSEAVLVTEGAEDSGALITADYAFSENRTVFAVPGPITSGMSKGPFKLIQKGAKLVTSPEEIIKEFQISNFKFQINTNVQKPKKGTKDEQKILDILENEGLHFDAIARKTKLSSSKLGSLLTLMEMKGMIKNSEGVFSIPIC